MPEIIPVESSGIHPEPTWNPSRIPTTPDWNTGRIPPEFRDYFYEGSVRVLIRLDIHVEKENRKLSPVFENNAESCFQSPFSLYCARILFFLFLVYFSHEARATEYYSNY